MWHCHVTELHVYDFVIKRGIICVGHCILKLLKEKPVNQGFYFRCNCPLKMEKKIKTFSDKTKAERIH